MQRKEIFPDCERQRRQYDKKNIFLDVLPIQRQSKRQSKSVFFSKCHYYCAITYMLVKKNVQHFSTCQKNLETLDFMQIIIGKRQIYGCRSKTHETYFTPKHHPLF